jgi:hypothetical protein
MPNGPAGRWLGGLAAAIGALVLGAPQPTGSAVPAAPPAPAAARTAHAAAAVRQQAVLAPGVRAVPPPARAAQFSVLQMNLCDSGMAGCYAGGRAVPEAAAVLVARRPDAVTLNEICARDLDGALSAAMIATWPGEWVYWAFQPAYDRSRNAPYRCRNGDLYGIGVLGHLAPASWAGFTARGASYPSQDAASPEERAWLCAHPIGSYAVCTAHLAADTARVALAQCRYLLNTAIPAASASGGHAPTVVGGDLNLAYRGHPDVRDCVPAGWLRTDDGGRQHVLATDDVTIASTVKIGMTHTDHPGLLVTLRVPRP